MLKLFPLLLEEGDIYISIDKHNHIPSMASPLVHVYTASAYKIEPPHVAKVKSDGWPTVAEAIKALFDDVAVKIKLRDECPIHFALDNSQIARPLRHTLNEYETHTASWANPQLLTSPQGISETATGYQGKSMSESNDMFPALSMHQPAPIASLPAHQFHSAQYRLQGGNDSALGFVVLEMANDKIHLDAHQDWTQTDNQYQLDNDYQLDNQDQQHQQQAQPYLEPLQHEQHQGKPAFAYPI